MSIQIYYYLANVFAFLFGAIVGSFLNVCIYRMPLGLSVNEPKRSFCPQCKNSIPWFHNLPLLSWLLLRGKCAKCSCRIPFRYFGVELLTALLFFAVWIKVQPVWILALPYWIFASLLIVATFIDLEHYIIPDEITWGGAAAGLILSLAIPILMGTDSHLGAGGLSLFGAALGFFILWLVVELGKKAFGKKKISLESRQPFTWVRRGDDADFTLGEEKMLWSEIFSRETDQLLLECDSVHIEDKLHEKALLRFFYDRVLVGETTCKLDQLDSFSGIASSITIPREAMGFGDVKFIAAIGAFLGWRAVLFAIMSGSVIGALIGGGAILLGGRNASAKIPFGPYLALGALIWLFAGEQLLRWYLNFLIPIQP